MSARHQQTDITTVVVMCGMTREVTPERLFNTSPIVLNMSGAPNLALPPPIERAIRPGVERVIVLHQGGGDNGAREILNRNMTAIKDAIWERGLSCSIIGLDYRHKECSLRVFDPEKNELHEVTPPTHGKKPSEEFSCKGIPAIKVNALKPREPLEPQVLPKAPDVGYMPKLPVISPSSAPRLPFNPQALGNLQQIRSRANRTAAPWMLATMGVGIGIGFALEATKSPKPGSKPSLQIHNPHAEATEAGFQRALTVWGNGLF